MSIGISDWRQVYPAIHREFAIHDEIRETLDQVYENDHPYRKEASPEPINIVYF